MVSVRVTARQGKKKGRDWDDGKKRLRGLRRMHVNGLASLRLDSGFSFSPSRASRMASLWTDKRARKQHGDSTAESITYSETIRIIIPIDVFFPHLSDSPGKNGRQSQWLWPGLTGRSCRAARQADTPRMSIAQSRTMCMATRKMWRAQSGFLGSASGQRWSFAYRPNLDSKSFLLLDLHRCIESMWRLEYWVFAFTVFGSILATMGYLDD